MHFPGASAAAAGRPAASGRGVLRNLFFAKEGIMPLIAMTREMGSLGKDVAQGVAEALGLEVVHHEIIDQLADKMRLRKSHVVRLLDGKASMLERLTADRASLAIYTADETYAIAQRDGGSVIRGWGATHLLRRVGHAV